VRKRLKTPSAMMQPLKSLGTLKTKNSRKPFSRSQEELASSPDVHPPSSNPCDADGEDGASVNGEPVDSPPAVGNSPQVEVDPPLEEEHKGASEGLKGASKGPTGASEEPTGLKEGAIEPGPAVGTGDPPHSPLGKSRRNSGRLRIDKELQAKLVQRFAGSELLAVPGPSGTPKRTSSEAPSPTKGLRGWVDEQVEGVEGAKVEELSVKQKLKMFESSAAEVGDGAALAQGGGGAALAQAGDNVQKGESSAKKAPLAHSVARYVCVCACVCVCVCACSF
jgi:hypothetical protein